MAKVATRRCGLAGGGFHKVAQGIEQVRTEPGLIKVIVCASAARPYITKVRTWH